MRRVAMRVARLPRVPPQPHRTTQDEPGAVPVAGYGDEVCLRVLSFGSNMQSVLNGYSHSARNVH